MLVIFGAAGENGPVDPACRRFVDGTPYVSSCLGARREHRGLHREPVAGRLRGPGPEGPGPLRVPAGRRRQRHPAARRLHQPGRSPAPGRRSPGTSYTWHGAPDGGACFADGTRLDLRLQLGDQPVGGGAARGPVRLRRQRSPAPTGSCPAPARTAPAARPRGTPGCPARRSASGYVFETDPWGVNAAVAAPAMGRFKHEAAAADPVRKVDLPDRGRDRRLLLPVRPDDLGRPVRRHAAGAASPAPAPPARSPGRTCPTRTARPTATRYQVSGAKRFNGGEGCYYADDTVLVHHQGRQPGLGSTTLADQHLRARLRRLAWSARHAPR